MTSPDKHPGVLPEPTLTATIVRRQGDVAKVVINGNPGWRHQALPGKKRTTQSCSACGGRGHNARGCPDRVPTPTTIEDAALAPQPLSALEVDDLVRRARVAGEAAEAERLSATRRPRKRVKANPPAPVSTWIGDQEIVLSTGRWVVK